ncbi:Noc2-domain-containing protein [Boletus reticuloceps]|uniref:Noc2-domain-containing protein n=1 Tax=Boletus reticuloceps TaxID=495285 RepID=A0A8I2YLG0_9AGAM|nr:Noc2-domain-containing protein [Boletus reticuloceps]
MGKKATKATRKFASRGQLKKTIQSRKKHQESKKKIESRRGAKGKGKAPAQVSDGSEQDDAEGTKNTTQPSSVKGMTVDDFLGAGFMENESDDEDGDEDEEEVADDESFASVDDLEDEGVAHMHELSKLAEKDPEFYKYLQENDRELLEFGPEDAVDDEDDEEEDVEMESETSPILTKDIFTRLAKGVARSLQCTTNSSPPRFKFTPVILAHHIPYKTLPNGKYKPPTQTKKQKALQKLILSYFSNIVHLIPQLTDNEMLQLAFAESAKILPYVTTSRRAVKAYLKQCLNVWSSGEDSVRIAAFLAIRMLANAADNAMLDLVMKSTYLELVRSSKSTSSHRLPSINLMKNSASDIFCLDYAVAYQHAFGYIRQLAIHLRSSMKTKTKDSYRQVYNWQYVHCVDFWALVLARACSKEAQAERGGESDLKPLIYPLVQVSLGAIKLVSNARSYPLHLHIARSMLHLSRHTNTYIPLTPYLLPIISSQLALSSKSKPSTLRPLDFESNIRAPAQYLKTRVYMEGLVDEATFILAEWLISTPVHDAQDDQVDIKSKPKGGAQKEVGVVKGLVERVEESAKWMEAKRKGVQFGPGKLSEVEMWEANLRVEESPLAKYVKVQRKAREKRKNMVDKAAKGEYEILDDS